MYTCMCGKLVVDIILQVNRLMSCTDIISFFVQVATCVVYKSVCMYMYNTIEINVL